MKLKCQCGHEFEVPEGVRQADCPACGRTVQAGGADWLSAVDVDDLELDVEREEAPPPEEVPPPPEPPPADRPQPEPSVPLPPGSQPMPGEAEETEPRGLLGFLVLVRDEPLAVVALLKRGIRGSRFLAEMVVSTGALALVWSFVRANLLGKPGIGPAGVNFFRFFIELGFAGLMLALLAWLLKRDPEERPNPLGVAEAVVLTRLLGLAVAVPIGIAVAVVVGPAHVATAVAHGVAAATAAPPSHLVQDLTRYLYIVVVFGAQTGYVMGLLRLGCLPSVAISVVISYSADTMALKVLP